jgi:putative oxidoreductase
MFKRFFNTDDNIAFLFLRLFLGAVMLPHGAQKLLGWFGGYGYYGTIAFFTGKLGIPYVVAVMIIMSETLGSVFLITGFMTRLAAFGTACVMTGAILMVHLEHGFFMNWFGDQKGEGFEFHLLAIGIALALMAGGGGKWSIDRLLAGRPKKTKKR